MIRFVQVAITIFFMRRIQVSQKEDFCVIFGNIWHMAASSDFELSCKYKWLLDNIFSDCCPSLKKKLI